MKLTLLIITNKTNFPQTTKLGKSGNIITNFNLTRFINHKSLKWYR